MSFRYIKFISSFVFLACTFCICSAQTLQLSDNQITAMVNKHSPLHGSKIPSDISERLGAAHVAGKYSLTKSPYLLEGCRAISSLGMGVVKLWFQNNPAVDYPYHSAWNLSPDASLVDFAKHPYFKEVFEMPFKTFVFSVRGEVNLHQARENPRVDFSAEEEAIYQLALHLLKTYQNKPVSFILQNWEGDWLMRGGTGDDAQWTPTSYPSDISKRVEVMRNWFKARQAGVERARKDAGKTQSKIYHAIEINKVMDSKKGIPGLTSHVLPQVKTDLVSWSCYDGLESAVDLWRGLDYIKANMVSTGAFPGVPIMIGEIGIPENSGAVFGLPAQEHRIDSTAVVKRWDEALSVFLAWNIPYIIHWEVYCNEVKPGVPKANSYVAEQLRGFWLFRPNGSKSYAANYLENLIKNHSKNLK